MTLAIQLSDNTKHKLKELVCKEDDRFQTLFNITNKLRQDLSLEEETHRLKKLLLHTDLNNLFANDCNDLSTIEVINYIENKTLIIFFITNFENIVATSDVLKRKQYFQLIEESFHAIFYGLSNTQPPAKPTLDKNKIFFTALLVFILIMGIIFSILSGFGITVGLLGFFSALILPNILKILLGITVSALLITLFLSGDFSTLSKKQAINFFKTGEMYKQHYEILSTSKTIIRLSAKQQSPDAKWLSSIIDKAKNITKNTIEEIHKKNHTAYQATNTVAVTIFGVFIIGTAMLSIKNGALAFLLAIGISTGIANILTILIVCAGALFFTTIYYYSQQERINDLVNGLWGRGASHEVQEIRDLIDSINDDFDLLQHPAENTKKAEDLPRVLPTTIRDKHADVSLSSRIAHTALHPAISASNINSM